MKNIILIVLAFLTFSFSYSQDWEHMGIDTKEDTYHIKRNNENTAWIKITRIPQKDDELLEAGTTIITKKLVLFKFDCYNRQIGKLAATWYSDDPTKKDHLTEYDGKMQYVIPDSEGELFMTIFCKLD